MVKAKQDDLLRLLRLKFNDLPPVIVKRVQSVRNVERLDALFEQAWAARSLKDIRWRGSRKRV